MNTFFRGSLLMQLAQTNTWMGLPPEIFKLVHRRTGSNCLSQTDKKLYALCAYLTDSIHFCPPGRGDADDMLVRLIIRYPNIRTLSFGDFGVNEEKQVQALIAYLKKHPLNHVRNLIFREIEGTGAAESKDINRQLLESLCHIDLKSIAIQVLYETSVLTGLEIQPILEKSINLRKFKLQCHSSDHPVIALSFAKQSKLISANFIEFCEPMDTLKSVKSCPRLKALSLINAHHSKEIKELLSDSPSERLNRLSIPGIKIDSDTELETTTKAHPNLEHLNITLGSVTDDGFKMIGENCPKLRSMLFSYQDATDDGLDLFSSKLSALEVLWIGRGYNITGRGVAAIAQNCPQLRILKLFRIKGIDSSSVESIAQHCKNLSHLEIGYSGPIDLDDIRYLALNLVALKIFKISNISGITVDDQKNLAVEFPQFM